MPVDIEFRGIGDSLLASFKAQKDGAVASKAAYDDLNSTIQKGAQANTQAVNKLNESFATTAQLAGEIGKASQGGGASKLAQDAGAAAESTDDLAASLVKAQIAARGLIAQQKQILRDAQAIQQAAAKGTITQAQATKEVDKLSKEYVEVTNLIEEYRSGVEQGISALQKQDVQIKSIRGQLEKAKSEAIFFAEELGKSSPEFIEAATRAGQLQGKIDEINKTIEAFNPQRQFAAILQLGEGAVGAFTAIQGVLGVIGQGSEDAERISKRIEGSIAILLGVRSAVSGLQEGFNNLRAIYLKLTAAQVANTTATEADIVAKGQQTVATTITAAATNTLTRAVIALEGALLANPFTAIAVAVGLLVTSIVLLANSTEDATARAEELLKELKKIEDLDLSVIGFSRSLELLESERQAIQDGNKVRAERNKIIRDGQIEQEALQREINLQESLRVETSARLLAFEEKLAQQGKFATQEQLKEKEDLLKAEEERLARLDELNKDSQLAQQKTSNELLAFDKQQQEKQIEQEKQFARERRDIREQLARDILALEKQIAQQIQQAQLQAADPRERIRLEQEAANAEIEQQRTNLLRKLAEQKLAATLTIEQFKALSAEELEAREDALIKANEVRLSPEEEASFQALKFAVTREGERQLSELLVNEANARISIIANARDREQAIFEQGLQERVDALRRAFVEEDQIQAFVDAQRGAFTQQRVLKAIDAEEKIALAQQDALIAGAQDNAELTRRLELQKLDIQEQFAKLRLDAIKTDTSQEAAAQRAAIELILAQIEAARSKLLSSVPQFSILDLLGIKPEDRAQVNADLAEIAGSVQSIIQSSIDLQQQQVDAQIEATDALIEDAQRRREELEAQLEQELEDQRAGLASNVDGVRAAIETQRALEQQALADKKRLVAERQRLARQQAIADSITQASSLATAGAQLFADGATKGIPGVIAAIAFAATLIATFLSIKAKIRAATQETSFRKGGYQPFIMDGPSHEGGGLSVVDGRSGKKVAEAEGREGLFFVRKENAAKSLPILHAVNEADWAKTARLALEQMTGGLGIEMEPTVIHQIVQQRERLQAATTIVNVQSNKALERGVRDLNRTADEIRGSMAEREEVQTHSDGTREVRNGSTRRVTKRRLWK